MINLQTAKLTAAAWMIVLLSAGITSPAAADETDGNFSVGVSLYRSRRFDTAASSFRTFLQDNPQHPRAALAHLFLALSLSETKEYAESRDYFLKYLKLAPEDPNAAEARYRSGECSFHLQDYPAAVTQLSEFLDRHPQHKLTDWALLLLGDSQLALDQYADSRTTLQKIVLNSPLSPVLGEATLSLGRALERLDLPNEALQTYQPISMQKESPLQRTALTRIATLHYKQANYPASRAAWNEYFAASANKPVPETASLGAGMTMYRMQAYEEAIQQLQQVQPDSALAPQAFYFSALCELRLDRTDNAREQFVRALKAAGTAPIGADIAFQMAQMEQQRNNINAAAQIYLDLADRWPEHRLASESLFNAAENRMLLNESQQAAELLQRLQTESPQFAQQPRTQILQARLLIAAAKPEAACTVLKATLQNIDAEQQELLAVARYQLVRASYDARFHEQAIQSCNDLTSGLTDAQLLQYVDALALVTVSSLELQQYAQAEEFSTRFLQLAPDREQSPDVRAARAVAQAAVGKTASALEELTGLCSKHADRDQVWSSVLSSAEMLLESATPSEAEAFFQLATTHTDADDVREAGYSGVAWTQFRSDRFDEAEQSFARLLSLFPNSTDLTQNLFMQARCIDEQSDRDRAATAWLKAWQQISADLQPFTAGRELESPTSMIFDTGKTAARRLQETGNLEDADTTWAAVLMLFPKASDAPALLDEWAWMHLNAEQFERSDEIYRRLLKEFPETIYAGEARLSLAESALQAGELEQPLQEMQQIAASESYSEDARERAQYHIVEILATTRRWQELQAAAATFLGSWPSSQFAARVRLFHADALLQAGELQQSEQIIKGLQKELQEADRLAEEWTHRTWVVLAESLLAQSRYQEIDLVEQDFLQQVPESRFTYQLMDVQGRRWKQQAPPDFVKSREYLRKVTTDSVAKGTETAARCQTMIADTFVLEKQLDDAVREYFKVYLNYAYDPLRALALYQAGICQIQLGRTEAAARDLKELIETFPNEDVARLARQQLEQLNPGNPPK